MEKTIINYATVATTALIELKLITEEEVKEANEASGYNGIIELVERKLREDRAKQ